MPARRSRTTATKQKAYYYYAGKEAKAKKVAKKKAKKPTKKLAQKPRKQ
jgi:transcription initiation factor IIE alpha subunit